MWGCARTLTGVVCVAGHSLPPCLPFRPPARTQNLYSPLALSLTLPSTHPPIHLSAHSARELNAHPTARTQTPFNPWSKAWRHSVKSKNSLQNVTTAISSQTIKLINIYFQSDFFDSGINKLYVRLIPLPKSFFFQIFELRV
jgi:hypothetical protein